ncbi:MAG: biopolymer transporter ExbD [Bacteroidales bacterium]|nr:biopolymer transporter ExbD [Bacteroidales bacterium]
MSIKSRNKVSAEFNMSSMTDIVFLLLIFFLITSTMVNPNGLLVSLPKSSNQPSQKTATAVTITSDLQFAVEQEYVPFELLESALKAKLAGNDQPAIAIHADKTVTIENLVKVMDMATRNKWKVVLRTTP